MEKSLDFYTLMIILCGITMGTVARLVTLHVDTRQNPSYPTGYFLNIVMGIVASALGSVAIPALLEGDFTAVTFLALGIQHFREFRNAEKESLEKLERAEYTARGPAYIDGISKTYESRNYISLLTSLLVVLSLKILDSDQLLTNVCVAAVTGVCVIYLLYNFTKGKTIGDICNITIGKITVEQSDLLVDGMFVSNMLGTQKSRELFLREGVGFVVEPKHPKFRMTIENTGQRQAMLFEAARTFGVKRFSFTRRNFAQGKLLIAFVPIHRDPEGILKVIKATPVLENSRKIETIMDTNLGGNTDGSN